MRPLLNKYTQTFSMGNQQIRKTHEHRIAKSAIATA